MPITADTVTIAQFLETEANVDLVTEITVNAGAQVLLATPVGQNDNRMSYASFLAWTAGTGDLVAAAGGYEIGSGAVSTTKIADTAVTTAKIEDAAITSAKIGVQQVENANIGTAAVDQRTIVAAGVGESEIATNAVTTVKIADANVTLAKLAADALTNVAVAESPANVALTSSTGTGDTIAAADAINAGVMLPADKAKLDTVATGANNYSHPNHTGEVTSTGDGATVIAPNTITEAKIVTGAVTFDKIATGAVDTSTLSNGAVETIKIGDSNVTLAKIQDVGTNTLLANADAVSPAALKEVTLGTLPTGSVVGAFVLGWDASGNMGQFAADVVSRKDGVDDIGPVSGSGITIDFNSGTYDNKEITLENSLGITLSASVDGKYRLRIRQDVVGGREATVVTSKLIPQVPVFPINTAPNKLTIFEFEYDSSEQEWHW